MADVNVNVKNSNFSKWIEFILNPLILVPLVSLLAGLGVFTWMDHFAGSAEDNKVEEKIEKFIYNSTGTEIDLTPYSKE